MKKTLSPPTVAMRSFTVYQDRRGGRLARARHLKAESAEDACLRLRAMLGTIARLWNLTAEEE